MLSFKTANLDDLEELIDINHPKSEEKREQIKKLQEKRIKNSLKSDRLDFIIVFKENKIVGHVLINYEEKIYNYPQIQVLFVDKYLRNKGMGTEIINEVEKRVKNKRFNKIGISVNPDNNPKAKKLYERLGYKKIGQKKRLDSVDLYNGKEDWVIDMFKILPSS